MARLVTNGCTRVYNMGHWNFPLVRIYINNLNQYINPTKLKQTLRDELSIYGPILDVVAHKNIKMRGQAFVVFETLDSAQAAVNAIQSEKKELFGKVINVSFAKTKSDATVKRMEMKKSLKHTRQSDYK